MKEFTTVILWVTSVLFLPFISIAQDNALLFDGTDDYLSFISNHPYGGDVTFEAWIRPSTSDGVLTLIDWTDGGDNVTRFQINNGVLQLLTDDGVNGGFLTGTGAIVASTWQHVAFTRTGGVFDFYINGVREIMGTPTGESGLASIVTIGSISGSFNFYPGLMDEVRIWSTALDETTIQNQMRTGLTGGETNLEAYYVFNETTGTSLPDLTANGYDGVLNNFPGPTDPNWQSSDVLTETFTVTNVNDDFAGSLRQAITSANASLADNVLIDFNFVGASTIFLATQLPNITRSMTIDGTTYPVYNFGTETMITLDLSGVTNGDGFNIASPNVTIQGMRIHDADFGIIVNGEAFDDILIQDNIINQNLVTAINIINGDNVTIQGNHIGVSGSGLLNQATSGTGIAISGCVGATIGGDRSAGDGNHLAGSAFSSYLINIAASDGVTIEGNLIGASTNGIDITTSRGVLINTTDNINFGNANDNRRNYIAGIDDVAALSISNGDLVNVINNYIGVGLLDSHVIGNNSGNSIPGITSTTGLTNFNIDGNVVSGANHGIQIGGSLSSGSIINNLIGVRPDGTTAFANAGNGINLTGSFLGSITIGGSSNQNTIANNNIGIRIDQTSFGSVDVQENSILCNTVIGIDIAGTPVVTAPAITSVSATEISGTTLVEDNADILIYQSVDGCNDDQGDTFLVREADVVSGGLWTVSGSFSLSSTYTAIVVDDETSIDAEFGASEFSTPYSTEGFVVTNVGNSGAGSLRQAITEANGSTADQVVITFGIISGGGPWTIPLGSALPAITRSMIIDGSTQPTWNMDAGLMVEIDGTSAGNASAFVVQSANVEIYGFHIANMQGNNGSTGAGVYISGETYDNFVIGGPGRGNVIGGGRFGISITSADGGVIQGNRIGTDMAGTTADGNGFNGISLTGSDGTLIGGDSGNGEGNVISSNGLLTSNDYGIEASSSDNLDIFGNLIGTDKDGNNDLGNLRGINITSGCDFAEIGGAGNLRNVISGNNSTAGIIIQSGTNHVIDNNIIGLNSAGTVSVGNGGDGIRLTVDGAGMIFRNNIISANTEDGIDLTGVQSAVLIEDNFIGTSATGTTGAGHGNLQHGIQLQSSNGLDNTSQRIVIRNNVISGNGTNITDNGINFSINNFNVLIQDNLIGVEANGTTALGNLGQGIELSSGTTAVTIGGSGNENTIANSGGAGIQFISVSNSQTNVIDINSIHCNTDGGIIYTITPDVDRPVINALSSTAISGTSTAPVNSVVQVFESTDGCNNDEGFNYLGSTTVQADGTWTYASALNTGLSHSAYIIEDGTGYISQFSAATLFETTTNADPGAGSLREAITNANLVTSAINIPIIGFNLTGDGSGTTWTISLDNGSGPFPDITRDMIIDGTSQSGWNMDTDRLIVIDGATNTITGTGLNNTVGGVEIYGMKITGFSDDGISFFGGTGGIIGASGKGNVINNNGDRGIEITLTDDVIIQGNRIGTNYAGTSASGNAQGISLLTSVSNTTVGGSGVGEGNLISGNTNDGITGNASGPHHIEGNIIGLNISHNAMIPNGGEGIELTTGGNHMIVDNIVSGNAGAGISLTGSGHTIISNTIGTDLTGNTPFGNSVGIRAAGPNTFNSWQIGTGNPGEGNVIAFNSGQAVLFTDISQTGNLISENSIYFNGLGIDLSGVANNNLSAPNFMVVTSSEVTFNGVASGDMVELFLSDGQGQGRTFLGSAVSAGTSVTVGGLSQTIESADKLVATRIDASNNTSPFSSQYLNYPTLVGAGNAIALDGVDDFVDLGDPDYTGTTAISVEAWINPDNIPSGPGNQIATIIGKGSFGAAGTSSFGLYFWGSDGPPFSELRASVDNGSIVATAGFDGFNINPGEWIHVAMTWSAGNPVNLYINGVNVDASAPLSGSMHVVGDPLQIGSSASGFELLYDGEIDELRIWNTELSEATIRGWVVEEFVSGADHPNDGNISSYYRFDESGGTSLGDLIGGLTGSVNGGATFNTSGAFIGDESAFTTTTSVALGGAASGNNLTINNIQGSPDITYLYRVNESPNDVTVTSGLNSLNTTDYYGVLQAGGSNPTFNAQWFYTNNSGVNGQGGENGIRFMKRENSADGPFAEFSSSILDVSDSALNIVIDRNLTSGEFAQGYTNPYPMPVPPGNALTFDGTDDYVAVPSPNSLPTGAAPRTIEVWFKATKDLLSSTESSLVQYGSTTTGQMFGLITSLNSPGTLYFWGQAADAAGGTVLVEDQWYHAAVTYDGTDITLYLNGQIDGTGTIVLNTVIDGNGLQIGRRSGSSLWDGDIDEVRIWDVALDQGTILDHASAAIDDTHPNYGNLVSYYRFDDSDGSSSVTTLRDLSGTNDGTLTNFPVDNSGNWPLSGALDTSVLPNRTLDFAGSNHFVDLGTGNLPIVGDITLEAWINLESYPTESADIISRTAAGDLLSTNVQYKLRVWSDGRLGHTFEHGSGTNLHSYSNDIIPLNQWTHVAVTRFINAGTADIRIYIDGILSSQEVVANIPEGGSTGTPYIGRSFQSGFEYPFDGQIDDLRIWDDVRTEGEIQSNLHNVLMGSEPNLVAYYTFNQGIPSGVNSGVTTLTDQTSNGNNGTLSGGFALSGSTSNWISSGAQDGRPNEPENLFVAEVSDTQIDLSWDDTAFDETGFTIERSDGNNTSFSVINTVGADVTTFSDNSVTVGNGYFYRVIANGATDNSNPSNEKFGSTISPPGNSLQFDGVDDYMEFDAIAPAMVGNESAMTIEFWFNANDVHTSTNSGSLFSINSSSGANTFLIYLGWSAGGTDNRLGITDNNASAGEISGPVMGDNSWHHVAYVRSGSTGSLYLDGSLYDTHIANFTLSSNDSWSIGQEFDPGMTASDFLDGRMDEVRVWTIARSEADILSTIYQPLSGIETGLMTYYRFDQDEGTDFLIPDRSTNKYDGTWNGNSSGTTTPQWPVSEAFNPRAPTDLVTTEISASRIDLSWTDNSLNETDFLILRSDGDNSNFVQIGTSEADAPSYVDNSVTAGNGYFYRVVATDGANDSAPSNEKFGSTISPPGNALDFDGVDDFVEIPDNSDVDFGAGEFTFELWFKPNTLADGNRVLIGKDLAGQRQFGLQYDRNFTGNNKNLSIIFYRDDDSFSGLDSDANAITDTDWHHIAAVRRVDDFEIYVDGVLIKSGVNILGSVGGAMSTSNSPIFIGASNDMSGFVDGRIDEVRIWNTARSQSEIQSNMLNTLNGNESGLVAYYRMDQDEATDLLVPDRSTNNNDGTWNGDGFGTTTPQWPVSEAFNPHAPSDLITSEITDTQIDLSWTDNSINETGFTIERSDGNNSSFGVINTVAADVSTYSDNSVTAGNGYFYRIIANGASEASGPSNEKFGSTITEPGNALDFDGIDDYVDLGNPDFSGFNAISVEAWVKPAYIPEGPSDETVTLIGKGATGVAGTTSFALVLEGSSSGGELFALVDNGSSIEVARFDGGSGFDFVADEWRHVAMTWVSGGPITLYIDGGQRAFSSNLSGSLNVVDDNLLLGTSTDINEIGFEGEMDEVRIWSDLRTGIEMTLNVNSTMKGDESNLIAYYRFDQDETTDLTLPDRSTNNHNGIWTDAGGGTTTPQWVVSEALSADLAAPNPVTQDIAVSLDAGGNVTITPDQINNGSTDDQTTPGDLILSLDITDFDCLDVGDNIVTLTVEDLSGKSRNATATVTVQDITAPSVVTQDITVSLDATGNAIIVAGDVNNGSTDNCSVNLSLDVTTFDCRDVGANTVTLTVTDDDGNSANATAIVTVQDITVPTVVTQDISVSLDATGNATIASTDVDNGSLDNCSVNLLSLDVTTFDCTDIGANTVTLTATDDDGNSTNATATVTIVDDISPTVVTQNILVSLDAVGNTTIVPEDVNNGSSDNCSVNLGLDVTTFDCTDIGANTVTLTVTDDDGNSSNATATVTIADNIGPMVFTQDISVSLDATGNAIIAAGDVDNGSTDNCSVNPSLDVTTFDCTDIGANTVTLTVTDDDGNSANATATVTVVDNINPIVVTQDINVSLDATGNVTIAAGDVDNGSSDNCSVNLGLDVITFDCTDVGANTVTLTVTDDEGNSANATATVTVVDNTNPTVVTQDINVFLDATGNATIVAGDVDNGSSDNCSVNLGLDVTTFDCTDVGANTVTLTVTDDEGNSANATATVTVVDNTNPTAVTQDISISLDATGNATIVAGDVDNGSSDNCSTNLSLDVTTFDCTDIGANTVTLTATDDEGNSTNAIATVTIVDDIPPAVVTQDITVLLVAGVATISATDIDDGSSDNCTFSLGLDVTDFTTADLGANTVTLTATDGSGNSANATATVTVEGGNQPPDIFYTFYLLENSPAGELIGTVVATDPENDPLTYTILSGNTDDAFAIGSSSGDITINLSEALDFEVTQLFNLIVQADDGNGGISMVGITINLIDIDEDALGINDLESKISVYPNPATDRLLIEIEGVFSEDFEIQLFTVSGSQVLKESDIRRNRDDRLELDLQDVSPGIYLLKITNQNEVAIKNVLVR